MNCPRFDGEIVLEEFAHPALADKGESARTGYRRLQKALVGTAFQLVKGKAAELQRIYRLSRGGEWGYVLCIAGEGKYD
jgi:hypothetical protein